MEDTQFVLGNTGSTTLQGSQRTTCSGVVGPAAQNKQRLETDAKCKPESFHCTEAVPSSFEALGWQNKSNGHWKNWTAPGTQICLTEKGAENNTHVLSSSKPCSDPRNRWSHQKKQERKGDVTRKGNRCRGRSSEKNCRRSSESKRMIPSQLAQSGSHLLAHSWMN
jgi:hypothetical protein